MRYLQFAYLGSSFLSPAHGLGGARATSFSFSASAPSSARKKFWPSNRAGKKEGGWGEGIFARLLSAEGGMGWEAFPPSRSWRDIKAKQFSNPFKRKWVARKIKNTKRKLFCFARRVSAGGNAGAGFQIIRAIFAQKRFELRSAIATNLNFFQNQMRLVARSPRLRRVSLRKKPCISELNQRGGQNQIQFFGKANGGSACEARNKQSLFPIFSVPPKAEYKASFFNPALCPASAGLAKGD